MLMQLLTLTFAIYIYSMGYVVDFNAVNVYSVALIYVITVSLHNDRANILFERSRTKCHLAV